MSFRTFLPHLPDREGHMLVSCQPLPVPHTHLQESQAPSFHPTPVFLPRALLGYFLL